MKTVELCYINHHCLTITPQRHRVWIDETELDFTPQELLLLEELTRNANQTNPIVRLYVITHGQDVSRLAAWQHVEPLLNSLHQKLKTHLGECIEQTAQGYKLLTNKQPQKAEVN